MNRITLMSILQLITIWSLLIVLLLINNNTVPELALNVFLCVFCLMDTVMMYGNYKRGRKNELSR